MTKEIEFIKHNLLYENFLEGFILAQIIFDEIGQPTDYRILEVNTSGLIHSNSMQKQVSGRIVRELLDSFECKWVEIFGNVVLSGKSSKFEIYSQGLNQWFKIQVYSQYKDNQFILIFEDASENKEPEKILITGKEEKIAESTQALIRKNSLLKAGCKQEKEPKAVQESLAAEVDALSKLHSLSDRFILKGSLQSVYGEILDAAIVLTQADKGAIRIFNEQNNCLEILEQRGYDIHSPNYFKYISIGDRTAAGKAFKDRKRIIVEDVSQATFYIEAFRQAILSAGVRALQATPLISSSGNIVGILVTFYTTLHQFEERELRMLDLLACQAADAIERIRAEETIQESEKRALALVEELRKMDQNKNQFLSILSHELRNPLASIMMSVSLLDRVTPGEKQFRQAKEIIERQTTQLSRLVDDLLDITKINQNKISLKKEKINLNELISRALEDYRELLASKVVEVELTSVPLYMEADPARLTQAIGNLLNNAAKFTQMGDKIQVSIWKDEDQQEAVICVKDEGLGIKPDILPDLFLPFIQVDSSLDRSSGGLGLGLAIVKGMVELHGGSVAAASEGLGKGAQFTIRLPLPEISTDNNVKQPETDGKPSRALRILVIDDIPDVAEIICSLLRLLGHEVISANSGSEGLVKAKAFHPEILFCDIGMPGMNGYEVAERFHCDNELKDIFLVALTGYAQQDDLERAKAAGFNRHLAKPVDLSILEQILAEVQ